MCRPLDCCQHGGSSYASRLKSAAVGPISFHTGSGAVQPLLTFCPTPVVLLAMSALLETLKYRPDFQSGTTTHEDFNSAEGKFGIPRFNGEATMLPEYTYRVRARAAKEKAMSKDEVEKLGPLGLRLVEGLRGQALRLAQQVNLTTLSSKDGAEALLKVFNETLKPRRAQEARELYAAGAREGGALSRQHGESMASYVSRRKAWWAALQGLDSELKIPDVILAEQVLQNSNITEDHKLMIRTMLQGKVTVESVIEELLSQHPVVHEREKRHRDFKGGKGWRKSGSGGGKFRSAPRGFHAEQEDDGGWDWDAQSQSLTGYTAFEEEEEEWTTEDGGGIGYESVVDYYQEDDDEAFVAMNFAMLCDSGLDLSNDEACAFAAEAMQLEHEAYLLRGQGKGKGHGGFSQNRHFDISGHFNLHERKARLAQLKSKTECRRCGQRGHWSGDAVCPKGARRGGGKKGGSKSPKIFWQPQLCRERRWWKSS